MHLKKRIRLIIAIVLLVQLLPCMDVHASDQDYTIEDGKRVPIPETYVLEKVIWNIQPTGEESPFLKEPEDIFINEEGFVFVVDTGNNRIIKLSSEGEFINSRGPEDKPLNGPQGIYVDDKGNMYIADTGNERILHLDFEGNYVEEFVKPDSESLGEDFIFAPTKLYISPTGYIYCIKAQAILTIDANNNFKGYLGQPEIGYSWVDALIRIFASEEQKRIIRKRTAPSYINIVMDKSGMIYATSLDRREGEIKKLNSVGKNIYRKYSVSTSSRIFDFLFTTGLEDKSFVFGERRNDQGASINPVFKDLAVDENGIVTALEEQTGKLYQYDQNGNLLTVFGGKGDQKGYFNLPSSLAVNKEGKIYVLDKGNANIQIFKPTQFIKLIHEAVNKYSNGYYDESYSIWNEILKIDENYQFAHVGIANALYKQERWRESMEEFFLADDRTGYSKAFVEYRYQVFRDNFILVVLGIVAASALLVLLIVKTRQISLKTLDEMHSNNKKMSTLTSLKMSLGVLFHPIETFDLVKNNRGLLNVFSGVIIFFAALFVRLFYIYTVHYPLQDIDIRETNIALEAVKLLLAPLTWVIASYIISAIIDGESRPDEVFVASSYCMVPYIVVHFFLALFSQVLSRNEIAFYAFMLNATRIWTYILFFISLKTLNDYRMFKAVVTYSISGITMGLIWIVSMLGYVLTGRLYQFVSGIILEIRMALL